MATQATQPSTTADSIVLRTYSVGITTASGALAGHLWKIIDPVGGAIFGASYGIAHQLSGLLIEHLGLQTSAAKTAAFVIAFIASISAGFFAAGAAGFSIAVGSAIWMPIAMCVASVIVRLGIECLMCCAPTTTTTQRA